MRSFSEIFSVWFFGRFSENDMIFQFFIDSGKFIILKRHCLQIL